MAGIKKTIYISEKNQRDIEYVKSKIKEPNKLLETMLNTSKKMCYTGIVNISEGAFLAISRGEFEKLLTVTFENSKKVVILKEEYHNGYADDIHKMLEFLNPDDEAVKAKAEKQ